MQKHGFTPFYAKNVNLPHFMQKIWIYLILCKKCKFTPFYANSSDLTHFMQKMRIYPILGKKYGRTRTFATTMLNLLSKASLSLWRGIVVAVDAK